MQLRPIDPVAKRRRMMLFANNGGPGLRQALLDGAPFLAELTHSLVLQRGTGSPTFTRASEATVMGYGPTDNAVDGLKLLTVAANEARFVGARRISEGVWSNTFADGSLIPAATNTGYLAEGARTQILPTADIRDMTTAAWTLGATMTRARTSVGADGAANSATRLTGGAVAATNTCYTTITAAASSRTYSALVKRVTGTGPVRIVQTGTETDISSQLATTGYALVQLTASVLNVAIGFKMDTNGDAIDVDFNQFEAGAFASSRIAAAVTRAADVLTYTGGDIANLKTLYCAYQRAQGVSSIGVAAALTDGTTTNYIVEYLDNVTARFAAGAAGATQGDSVSTVPYVAGTTAKVAMTRGLNASKRAMDGVAQPEDTTFAVPTIDRVDVGHYASGQLVFNGNVGHVIGWTRNPSQSELDAITV